MAPPLSPPISCQSPAHSLGGSQTLPTYILPRPSTISNMQPFVLRSLRQDLLALVAAAAQATPKPIDGPDDIGPASLLAPPVTKPRPRPKARRTKPKATGESRTTGPNNGVKVRALSLSLYLAHISVGAPLLHPLRRPNLPSAWVLSLSRRPVPHPPHREKIGKMLFD